MASTAQAGEAGRQCTRRDGLAETTTMMHICMYNTMPYTGQAVEGGREELKGGRDARDDAQARVFDI